MNYRHAFHAGNHADVFKHAALCLALDRLLEKPQPLAVLDTHAGLGVYDLTCEAAQKTREYERGAGKLMGADLSSAPAYAQLLRAMNPAGLTTYPGSPEILRRLLRSEDRLMACELHPEDFAALKARYRHDRQVAVHHRDGYEALSALLPPPERRGLVFIDPPFEAKDEDERLAAALAAGLQKWPTGVFVAWYPVKERRVRQTLLSAAQRFPKALHAEFNVEPWVEGALAGGGLIVANAPWRLDEKLRSLCKELAPILGQGGANWAVEWLTAP